MAKSNFSMVYAHKRAEAKGAMQDSLDGPAMEKLLALLDVMSDYIQDLEQQIAVRPEPRPPKAKRWGWDGVQGDD